MPKPPVPLVRIRALGPLRITCGESDATPVTQPRRLALAAYMALAQPRGLHSRDTLMALLWPDANIDQGRQALRNSLHELRKALGDVIITSGRSLVGLDASRIDCDVYGLEADLAAGRVDEARAHHAELLDGFHVSDAPEFERWLDATRAALRERVFDATRMAIAVLPVVDASTAGDAGHICDAVLDGMLRRLARMPNVRLLARGAVSRYRDRGHSALEAGRELAADLVVDSILTTPAGTNEVEVRLEVIRVPDGVLLRETALRADRENLFVLEGALTSAIVPALGRAADDDHDDRRTAQPTKDAEAYVLYVRGLYLFLRAAHVGGRPEDLHQSRDFFERALARDAEFGLAYAGLANYFAVCAARNLLSPFAEHFGHAIALSHRALAIDPALAIPHVHLGVQAMYLESDWPAARREFARAVMLDPSYAEARRFLGILLFAMGERERGLRELREAVRLEPQMPFYRNSLADALLSTGEYASAIVELRVALQHDGAYRAARERLVRCLERTERFGEAIAERRFAGDADAAARFERAFAGAGAAGYRRQRELELRALIATTADRVNGTRPAAAADLFNPPELQLALAHAELGEWDTALEWERRAVATQPGKQQWFRGRPELDRLRSRPGPSQVSRATARP